MSCRDHRSTARLRFREYHRTYTCAFVRRLKLENIASSTITEVEQGLVDWPMLVAVKHNVGGSHSLAVTRARGQRGVKLEHGARGASRHIRSGFLAHKSNPVTVVAHHGELVFLSAMYKAIILQDLFAPITETCSVYSVTLSQASEGGSRRQNKTCRKYQKTDAMQPHDRWFIDARARCDTGRRKRLRVAI